MNLDSRIRSVLDEQANTVEAPWPPPLEELLVDGVAEVRRRRARRRLAGAVSVSLVAAAAVGVVLIGQQGPPQREAPVVRAPGLRIADLPVGESPTSLYCMDGVVRWGDAELPLRAGSCNARMAQAGDSAVVVDFSAPTVTVLDREGIHQLQDRADAPSSPLVFDPDGTLGAWVSHDRVGGRQEVVLWDTERRVEWKRVQAPEGQLNLEGIDASGKVYLTSVSGKSFSLADDIWVWPSRESGGFRRVVGLGDFVGVADVPPDGLAVLKSLDGDEEWHDETGVAVSGTVTDQGEFVLGSATNVRPVVWSPDRSRHLLLATLTVVSPSGDAVSGVRLRIPRDVELVDDPSWESSDSVLLPVAVNGTSSDGAVLRCAADTGRCEVAARGGQDLSMAGSDADNFG